MVKALELANINERARFIAVTLLFRQSINSGGETARVH